MADDRGTYFIVLFENPISKEEMERAEPLFEPFKLKDDALLLYSRNQLPATVASDLFGLDSSKPGVVFKLNGSFSGYYYAELFDWLREE